ncbi:MAG: hypothetical protein Q8L48_29665 [Archangium sp.]|nr:hypothetical protein [Archangium sp.]
MKTLLLAVAVFSSVALAQNVPQQVSLSARLSNAGAPLTGSHTLLLKLFDTPSGGTESWSESTLASADNGLVALTLGAQSPLTPVIFDGRPLFLEVSVDGQVLSPRLVVTSVPYAVRSTLSASSATLGNLTPGDVARANHTHAGTYLPVGASLGCTGTDKVVGLDASGSVICAPDSGGTTYVAGAGITIAGSSVSVAFAGAGVATTAARSDHNHAGAYLPVGTVLTCPVGQHVTALNANGSVTCQADLTPGTGLIQSGTTIAANYLVGALYGTSTSPARADHGHGYVCPLGFRSHWFATTGSPEGTKVLCTRPVAQAATWVGAVRACATNYSASRLCTIQELTIARGPATLSHTQEVLLSGYWLADRLADDFAAVTNATTGDNFDAQQDPATTATGFYCCTDGNFIR